MARTVVTYNAGTWDVAGVAPTTLPTTAPVTSVFGRTGAVTAQSGDYTAAQVGALASGAAAGGALDGTYPNPGLANSVAGTGLSESGDVLSVNYGTTSTTACVGNDSRLSDSRAPTGAAGGDLAGTYPNPTLNANNRAPDWRALSVFGASVLAESIPRTMINTNGSLLSTARLSSVAIPVYAGIVITNVGFLSGTTALSAPANVWFALCDSSFNVIRQSTDQVGGATWAANTAKTLAVDSLPVTAGARVASTTVTLTFPTLSESLTSLIAVNDSVVVSNANIAAYNGTFTVNTVSSTQITYTAGSSATDSLAAPFPTVKLAAGKRTYTVPTSGIVYAVVMVKGTVPTLGVFTALSQFDSLTPVLVSSGDTGLTGTCPSPIAHATGSSLVPACAVT